jgi:protein-S-isoprenylcysteine O-methyltransferase Ste14
LLVGAYYLASARNEDRALSQKLEGYRHYAATTGAFLPRFRHND